VKRFKMWLNHI